METTNNNKTGIVAAVLASLAAALQPPKIKQRASYVALGCMSRTFNPPTRPNQRQRRRDARRRGERLPR